MDGRVYSNESMLHSRESNTFCLKEDWGSLKCTRVALTRGGATYRHSLAPRRDYE